MTARSSALALSSKYFMFPFMLLVFIPYPGYSTVESQQAPGTPDQNTESGGGGGGRKEGKGGQEPGPPTQVSQK